MKPILALLTFLGVLAFVAPGQVEAHDHPFTTTELAAVVMAEVAAHDRAHPEYATNCRTTIRSTRTSAVGVCYNYSGSGSTRFQVAALMFDGCRSTYWAYGNVGWVYYPGVTTTGKWSYVYSPPGKWYITYAKIVVWKP